MNSTGKWWKFAGLILLAAIAVYLGLALSNYSKLQRTLERAQDAPNESESEETQSQIWKKRFASASYEDRRALVFSARNSGDRAAIPALGECLDSEDVWLRTHAARVLYILGDKSAYSALVSLLDFKDGDAFKRSPQFPKVATAEEQEFFIRGEIHAIRFLAAQILAENKEEKALPLLIRMFKEEPDQGLAEALATYGKPEIADLIYEQMVKNPSLPGYAEALVKMKDGRAIPLLKSNFEKGAQMRRSDPKSVGGRRLMEDAALTLLRFGNTDHLDYLSDQVKNGSRRMAVEVARTGCKEAGSVFHEILKTANDAATVYLMGLCLAKLGFAADSEIESTMIAAVERLPLEERRTASWALIPYPSETCQALINKYNPQVDPALDSRRREFQAGGIDAMLPKQ